MTGNGRDWRRISRRSVLQGARLVAAAGVTLQAASCASMMRPTLSKEEAGYQDMPKGQQHCSGCVHFEAPNACSVVKGDISPNGWCQRYSAKG